MKEVTFELKQLKPTVLVTEGDLCLWRLACCERQQNTHQELPLLLYSPFHQLFIIQVRQEP